MVSAGSPTWIDLGTTDLDSSISFYRDLFGWNCTSTRPDFGRGSLGGTLQIIA